MRFFRCCGLLGGGSPCTAAVSEEVFIPCSPSLSCTLADQNIQKGENASHDDTVKLLPKMDRGICKVHFLGRRNIN